MGQYFVLADVEQYCLRRFKKPLFFRAKDFRKNYIIYWYFVSKSRKLTIRFGLGQSQEAQQKELHRSFILQSDELWILCESMAFLYKSLLTLLMHKYVHKLIIIFVAWSFTSSLNHKVMIWCGLIRGPLRLLVLLARRKTLYYHYIITLWFTEVVKDHAKMVSIVEDLYYPKTLYLFRKLNNAFVHFLPDFLQYVMIF